jgi:hypothetical protein
MPTGILPLTLPDWSSLDTECASPLPFALWTIGDQCLIHHWLDHAVNQGYSGVKFYVKDRPSAIRQILAESTLWPITTEIVTLAVAQVAPAEAISVEWLPGVAPPPRPTSGWELIERAAAMEKAWLENLAQESDFKLMSIGFSCRIHPDAILCPPYFIGDHVFIGPGAEIGPFAVVGNGSVISGANRVSHSHLSPHSFLGPVTSVENCRLENGVLFNLKHRVRLAELETHLLSNLKNNGPNVSLKDRLHAVFLYFKTEKSSLGNETFKTFDGRTLPGRPHAGLSNRRAWLRLVWQGKMSLYGILPRNAAQFDRLSAEWQNIIRHAPIGVFSYADTQGCHSPEHVEEAIHAVYQASLPPETFLGAIRHFVFHLKSADLNP